MPDTHEMLTSKWHEERLLAIVLLVDRYRRADAAGIAACLSKDHFEAIPRVVVELADSR